MAKPRPALIDAFKARYSISENGCWVWTGERDKNGYGLYVVSKTPIGNGKYARKRERANRLAWILLRGEIPEGLEVCHRCDNTSCVNPDHLFVDTHKNNMQDRDWKGRHSHGAGHYMAQLTESDVIDIRSSKEPLYVLSQRYGISQQSLSEARSGKTWKHVDATALIKEARKGVDHGRAKLLERDVRGIRARAIAGESLASLARDYSVSETLIRKIISREIWTHI